MTNPGYEALKQFLHLSMHNITTQAEYAGNFPACVEVNSDIQAE